MYCMSWFTSDHVFSRGVTVVMCVWEMQDSLFRSQILLSFVAFHALSDDYHDSTSEYSVTFVS